MRRDDVRFAAAARDDGIRKITKFTWRAGAAGVACSALIAAAFGHHVAAQQTSTGTGQHSSNSNSGNSNSNSGNSNSGNSNQGTIVVPAQPPAPAPGGGQVTSGAS
jgi:hypothetical protein